VTSQRTGAVEGGLSFSQLVKHIKNDLQVIRAEHFGYHFFIAAFVLASLMSGYRGYTENFLMTG
jgi:hypothetical protein